MFTWGAEGEEGSVPEVSKVCLPGGQRVRRVPSLRSVRCVYLEGRGSEGFRP